MSFKFFTILLFIPFYSFSQNNYVFQHLTVEDGLLDNARVRSFQDSEGFYWFSTINGIQRFDGKNFVTYRYNNSSTKNTPREWASNPVEDKNKNIWIINDDGINMYDRKKRKLIRLYMPDAADSNTNNVSNLFKDAENKLWIITTKNIFQYDYKSGNAVLISKIINDPEQGIATITFDINTSIFWMLLSKNGRYEIASYQYKKKQFHYLIDTALNHLLIKYNPIAFFKIDGSGNLWMADYFGTLCKYNTNSNQLTHYTILQDRNKEKNKTNYSQVYDCMDDDNGSIWFGVQDIGLIRYDKRYDSFTVIQYDNGSEYGLHYDEAIYSFLKDREGNIWVDTDLGMNVFNPHFQQFKYLSQQPGKPTQFTANVTSIFESSTRDIWISTWGNGIFKYDSNFVLKKNYVNDKKNVKSYGEPLNRAWSFGEDSKKQIWIGSQYGMLSVVDPSTDIFINRIVPEFEKFTVMHIAKDYKNNFWFGLYNGMLGEWLNDSNKIIVFKNLYESREPKIIDGLLIDNKNMVWLATAGYGFNRFNVGTGLVDKRILTAQHVFSPFSLNDSVIMGGSLSKGLFLYNTVSGNTSFINTTHGLSSNLVYGGIADNKNNTWVFTGNAIERKDFETGKILHYGITDGIRDHLFLQVFCKLKNGFFLCAANSGIIYFHPDSIRAKPAPPDVLITDFDLGGKSFPVDSLLQYVHINLSYDQNVITIAYASVSFLGRRTDEYFYELSGVDHSWVSAGTRRSVTYANLAPGNYTFNVRSQNSDGIKSVNITTLTFIIHPPWWRTWAAYLLWLFLLVVIMYAGYAYLKRNREAVSNMRQRIATDLHDDIGSTLNSISVYSEIAGRQLKTNAENAGILLEKMGSSSRNMIDTMNDIVWAVSPKNDNFENILLRMQYFAGELLSGKNILLQFEINDNVKNIKLSMGQRKNFFLIFKEAINNAYKYADGKIVNVKIFQQAQNLVMVISDDGRGFEITGKSYAGNGMKNMLTRAIEIHARLSIKSELTKGTQLELVMPVN
ncbi:MAG: hypothetical protein H0W12_00735 [Chitinophagaceae bacterium]|nr:hypothetical protein [Chitinophagaceae bacterium]